MSTFNSGKGALIVLILLAMFLSSVPALAIDVAPTVSLTANATSVTTSVTLTAVAVDVLDNKGIMSIKLYENGTQIGEKNCAGISSCTFVKVATKAASGTFYYYAKAWDKGSNVAMSNAVTVTFNVNEPPVLAPIGNRNVNESQTLQFIVSATDPNGDPLSYSASGLPSGASFNPSTRTFSWTPGYTQAGVYPGVTFTVTDGALNDSETITINVNNMNRDPVITSTPPTSGAEGSLYSYDVDATDPDGDTPTYSLAVSPGGMTIDSASGLISWTPGYAQAGDHGVTVNVTDGLGGSAIQSWTISVANTNRAPVWSPVPSDQAIDEDGSLNYDVDATDPDGDPITYSVNDSEFSIDGSGLLTWTPAPDWYGTRDIRLTASDGSLSVTADITITVNSINDAPVAVITSPADSSAFVEGTLVDFDASGSSDVDDGIASYDWDFGDSGSGSGVTASHTYAQNGTYTVTLNVTDASGLSSAVTISLIITDTAPTADFNSAPASPVEGGAVSFSDLSTGYDTPLSYLWDFGDGNTSTLQNPSNTYVQNGTYTITLTVTDNDGSVGGRVRPITIDDTSPTADAGADQAASEGDDVTFDGSGSSGYDTPLTYFWDFGDGENATGSVAIHAYDDSGTYTVTLTVTDSDGSTSVDTASASIGNVDPTAAFDYSPTSPVEGDTVTFDASASTGNPTDPITLYAWDFGDGNLTNTTSATIDHVFADDGDFDVALTVWDEDSSDSALQTVSVSNADPVLELIGDRTINETDTLTIPLNATDAGVSDVLTYGTNATFGTFDSGTGLFTWVTGYADAGDYSVNFSVSDGDGGTDWEVITITVLNVNRVPLISIPNQTTSEDTPLTINVSLYASDPDGDSLDFTVTAENASEVDCDVSGDQLTMSPALDWNGVASCTVQADDGSGGTNSSTFAITVTPVNNAPVANITAPVNGSTFSLGDAINFSGTGTDVEDGALSGDSLVWTSSLSGNFGNGTTVSISTLSGGNHTITLNVTDSGGLSDAVSITITIADTKPPVWSNLLASPASPVTYVPAQDYEFNSTWTDDGAVDTVLLEFDGVNYTALNVGDEYYYTLSDLAAGAHTYVWYANDTAGNSNSTGPLNYTIDPATTVLTLTALPSWSETYGTATNVSCSANNAESALQLYRNGSAVSNPDVSTLAAGAYGYVCNATATENWTTASTSNTLTVSRASTATSLYLNGVQSNLSVAYGATSNATAATSGGSVTLYRDGSPVSNPEIATLGVGTYNYTAMNAGDENYTASSATWFLTVATTSGDVHLYLNGAESNATITYGTQVNATATTLYGTVTLYRNGTDVSGENGVPVTLGTGTYNYTAASSGDANHTSATVTYFVTVDKAASAVNLLLDGTDGDATVERLNTANITGERTAGEGGIQIFENGSLIGSGVAPLEILRQYNSTGTFNITVIYGATANYTASSETHILTVQDTTPPAGVSGLNETAVWTDFITWGWANPTDGDFDHVEVWINGTWAANVTGNSYNATSLNPSTTYEVETRTVDTSNNVNATWVNDTATTGDVRAVDIWAVPTSQTVDVGVSATYVITVNNTGTVTNTFNISFANLDNASIVQLSGTQLVLNPGQNGTVNLTVANNNPGMFDVDVTATDADNATVTDTDSTQTNVSTTDTGWIYTSWVNGTYYLSQSTGIFDNINDTEIRDSNVSSQTPSEFAAEVLIINSNITGSRVTDLAGDGYAGPDVYIVNCTIINSTKTDAYCVDSYIKDSVDPRSNTTGSNITNTTYSNSNITYSNVSYSYVDWSDISYSDVNGSDIRNSTVANSTLNDVVMLRCSMSGSIVSSSALTDCTVADSYIIDSNVTYSTVTNSSVTRSDVNNSVIEDSNVTDSKVYDSLVNDSIVDRSILTNSTVGSSKVTNSSLYLSNATGSTIVDSTMSNSTATNSTIVRSNLTDSTVILSNLTNVTALRSWIFNSTLADMVLIDANVTNGVIYNGTITIGNSTYNATNNTPLNLSDPTAWPAVSVSYVPSSIKTNTVVNFTASISGQFDTNTTLTYEWDFENDGIVDYTALNDSTAQKTYGTARSYTARARVTDGHGSSASDTVVLTVARAPSSRGGGGTIYTPQPQDSLSHMWIDIQPGIRYVLPINLTDIAWTSITFSVNQTVDKVFMELARLFNATQPGIEHAYQYVTLNISPVSLQDVEITFKVDDSWFAENGLDGSKAQLAYYLGDGVWEYLPTLVLGEKDNYTEYKSLTERLPADDYVWAITAPKQGPTVLPQPPIGEENETAVAVNISAMPGGRATVVPIDLNDLSVTELAVTPSVRITDVQIIVRLVNESYVDGVAQLLSSAVQYFEVTAMSDGETLSDAGIDSLNITFKLSKSFIAEHGLDASSVRLERWDSSWERLPTVKVAEDDESVTYVATSPGFGSSLYAIAADAFIHPALIAVSVLAIAIVAVALLLTKFGIKLLPAAKALKAQVFGKIRLAFHFLESRFKK